MRFVPRPLTTAIIAKAMPAAIRPYSIAVAPETSDTKLFKIRLISTPSRKSKAVLVRTDYGLVN